MPAGQPGMTPEAALADAASRLTWGDLPPEVVTAIRRLFIDWLGSALGGSGSEQAQRLAAALAAGGLVTGGHGDPGRGGGTASALPPLALAPPLVAALLNGASGHVLEMDDLHNDSIYHPGTCVFPAALAVAEALGASPRAFLTAAVAGYEVSLRVGEALGPEHYRFFHTTGTAGTFGAAVAAGHLLGLDARAMLSALGSAGTQAAGLWQFLADGTMSKQLHTAKAAFNGALSAYLASEQFSGTSAVLLGEKALLRATASSGAAAGDEALRERQRERLLAGLEPGAASDDASARFAVFKTPRVSLKFHASCRHTHPAVDALLLLLRTHDLGPADIAAVHARVNSAAFDLLNGVEPSSPWAAKFSLPFCLAQAALHGGLPVDSFRESALAQPEVVDLMSRVTLEADRSLDREYPRRWAASVEVETTSGETLEARVDSPKGDPENPLSEDELSDKFRALAALRLDPGRVDTLWDRLQALEALPSMQLLLGETVATQPGGVTPP